VSYGLICPFSPEEPLPERREPGQLAPERRRLVPREPEPRATPERMRTAPVLARSKQPPERAQGPVP
jgi:hypothetical protein